MRVAVITAFHAETPEMIERCHASVRAQTVPCDHIMVGDNAKVGAPATALHVHLPRNAADYGDTPRAVGSAYAAGLGHEVICYLDGDNWLHPQHVESVLACQRDTGAAIVSSYRSLYRLDGSYMAVCISSDGQQFCDTNCMALFRPAFHLTATWSSMDERLHPIGDRVMWKAVLQSGLARAHTSRATVHYLAAAAGFYRDLREPIPPGARDSAPAIRQALAQWKAMGHELPVQFRYTRYAKPVPLQAG